MERQILHVDVNNAFLSWTAVDMLKNGYETDIRTIPSVIGGDETKRQGIVLAKSMKAKEFGITTAETIYQARKKCPSIQIFSSNFKIYKYYSDKLYNLLLEYTDKIERFSIDECFLDMTLFLMNDTLLNKAKEIQKRVRNELGFTVNIGVSNNKILAKMASDFQKPDKIHTLFRNEISSKMWPLPISELFGLGKKTAPKLYNMQIKNIGDLAKFDKSFLTKKFGKRGSLLWEYANGIDNSEVKYLLEKPKCIGNSTTLPENISNINTLEEILLALTELVAFRLRRQELLCTTINIQLRNCDFVDISHQRTFLDATDSTKQIFSMAKKLLNEMFKEGTKIRLIGVSVNNLVEKGDNQISFFSNDDNDKQKKLDTVVDSLKNKYGYNSVTRAGKLNVTDTIKLKDV